MNDFNETYEIIEIFESKFKNIVLFFMSLIMTLMGALIIFVILDNGIESIKMVFMFVAGVVVILFFGFCFIFIFKQSFRRDPVIVLNKEGFLNKKQSYSKEIPFIPWSRVKKVSLKDMFTESFVCIDIEDEEEYVESMSKTMRMGIKANIKMGFPAICLSANSLKGFNNKELFHLFGTFYSRYKYENGIEEQY
ncbi:STM3941 family protein [Miniphocaeibacter massiliensis]|uniref:STM3941 family protein n=1 Tax=Miniphocaeibacter massiliensis TaxID=2041841 RepID=UPI000C077421|nr:STM3941 family protein [Miniphocaeibacter massiliensis]